MEALAQLARDLNDASDELTAFIKRREEEVSQLKLGVEAEGTFTLGDEEVVWRDDFEATGGQGVVLVEQTVLAYSRHCDRWRIVARTYELPADLDLHHAKLKRCARQKRDVPLLSASRDVRIVAVESGALDDLLDAIAAEARSRVASLRSLTHREN
jgi:hypothetical protein